MPSLELTTQKAISVRHREKADEMTFPEKNHMNTYSRIHTVRDVRTIDG